MTLGCSGLRNGQSRVISFVSTPWHSIHHRSSTGARGALFCCPVPRPGGTGMVRFLLSPAPPGSTMETITRQEAPTMEDMNKPVANPELLAAVERMNRENSR